MNAFFAALWAEALKALRSKISVFTAVGILILPLAGALFMAILKNPDQWKAMGLVSAKAQIMAGTADWPAFINMMAQGIAVGGLILLMLITAWVFGREFSDHTAKELLALPTPRAAIVAAKFLLIAGWGLALVLIAVAAAFGVGVALALPGWSAALGATFIWTALATSGANFLLMPFVAWIASLGRGYLPPVAWTILTLLAANIASLLGWGDWFPWAIPVLVSGFVKPDSGGVVGLHSVVMLLLALAVGAGATFYWWQSADQAK